MRQAVIDTDQPVDRPDHGPRHQHGQHDRRPCPAIAENRGPDDRTQGNATADRQINAVRQNHDELAHRQHRDDRRLSQDVAQVARGQGIGRKQARHDDHRYENQDRPGLQDARDSDQPCIPAVWPAFEGTLSQVGCMDGIPWASVRT